MVSRFPEVSHSFAQALHRLIVGLSPAVPESVMDAVHSSIAEQK